eukprot:TRINITY_DN23487_c0_g1_i1.p3 TRINITY_DN23487_c0_g1~~TRINITY_DN23487_c0_g1_i1.p3  ORF type:complete len:107 (+),score=24.08 TRINITY_DN23487_c0_g1_i1:392-712(+)
MVCNTSPSELAENSIDRSMEQMNLNGIPVPDGNIQQLRHRSVSQQLQYCSIVRPPPTPTLSPTSSTLDGLWEDFVKVQMGVGNANNNDQDDIEEAASASSQQDNAN